MITLGLIGKSLPAIKLELMKPTLERGICLVSETDLLMNAQSPTNRRSTLKSAVFGVSSSLPPLVGVGGGLVCERVGKADVLSNHFDSKLSRESVDLLLTCHPSPSLVTFAFRSTEVRHLFVRLGPLWWH